jgi:hypothetical protein
VGGEDALVPDEPQDPQTSEPVAPPGFEPPHSNGAVQPEPRPARKHAPWEFLILTLLVLLVCVGIILGWTLVGSRSPEKLDATSAAAISAACDGTQAKLKTLAQPYPTLGADRVARVRTEDVVLRSMVAQIATVHPPDKTPAAAVQGWSTDWTHMIDARDRYADDLQHAAGTDTKVRLIYPAVNAIKPITHQMDDFVRENHPRLDACFSEALQLEVVEGPRDYKKVTK